MECKLTIRRLKAKLPDDFYRLVQVKELKRLEIKVTVQILKFSIITVRQKVFLYGDEAEEKDKYSRRFSITGNQIYFTGSYSKNIFKYWLKKIKEILFPEKVILEYISIKNSTKINTKTVSRVIAALKKEYYKEYPL